VLARSPAVTMATDDIDNPNLIGLAPLQPSRTIQEFLNLIGKLITTRDIPYFVVRLMLFSERMSNTILSRGIYFLFIATSTFHRLLHNLARCYLQRRLS